MFLPALSTLVPRPSAIISVGGKDGLVYTVAIAQLFPPKVGERNLTRQYIIRITFKGGFSEGAFILSFFVSDCLTSH